MLQKISQNDKLQYEFNLLKVAFLLWVILMIWINWTTNWLNFFQFFGIDKEKRRDVFVLRFGCMNVTKINVKFQHIMPYLRVCVDSGKIYKTNKNIIFV